MKHNFTKMNFRIHTLSLVCAIITLMTSCSSKPTDDTSNEEPASNKASARPTHWGYEGDVGPSTWASLDPVYAKCGEGQSQSPINVATNNVNGDANWNFDYKATSLRIAHNEHMDDILDNGHTIQVTVDEGSVFNFEGTAYNLKQFHFHTPSEHTIDGEHLPMEMHMVHQAADESLAVVSVLFEEGDMVNDNVAKIVAHLPNAKGESKHMTDVNLELQTHLPNRNQAYHYLGSLTTPPCSESVQWLILSNPVKVSAEQVNAFSSRIGANNRPVQSLNERVIEVGDLIGETTEN